VRDALWAVVNDGGTGKEARVEASTSPGKTSTVQVVGQKSWLDSTTLPFEQRDHAWFASFAPAYDPSWWWWCSSSTAARARRRGAGGARALRDVLPRAPARRDADVLAAVAPAPAPAGNHR
jgi:membrane peptidoglycan carboxypeptidase